MLQQQRTSLSLPSKANLYCVSCDSQLGIFENEWAHLTTSYARSQERGTHFGTEVGIKTQVVPEGSAERNAEGCEMSEVYCVKCSTVVAQYCRKAPELRQKPFLGQYFYKVSRVYLKDSHTSANIEMNFTDRQNDSSQRLRNGVTSTTGLSRQKFPSPRAASDASFRQSHPPPSNHTWQRPQLQSYYSRPSISSGLRPESTQPTFDVPNDPLVSLAECASRITATDMRLANQEMRFNTSQENFHGLEVRANQIVNRLDGLDGDLEYMNTKWEGLKGEQKELEECIHDQDLDIENHQEKLAALQGDYDQLESFFHDQDDVIKEQQRKIEEQNQELQRVTARLDELQNIIDDLRATVYDGKPQRLSISQSSLQPQSQDFLESLQTMVKKMSGNHVDSAEIRALRGENDAMKTRLKTIAGAIGLPPDGDIDTPVEENNVLGKRKREADHSNKQQQKMSRTSKTSLRESVQSIPLLPTPDSSQNNGPSLSHIQKRRIRKMNSSTVGSGTNHSPTPLAGKRENHVIHISDDEIVEQQGLDKPVISSIGTGAVDELSAPQDGDSRSYLQRQTKSTPRHPANPIVNQPAKSSTIISIDDTQPDQSQQKQPLLDNAVRTRASLNLMSTIPRPEISRRASVSFASNRPVSMLDRMRSPSVRNNPIASNSPRPSLPPLPHSQANTGKQNGASPFQEHLPKSSLQRVETFSGALSRGETLENIVQRSQVSSTENAEGLPQQNSVPNHRDDVQDKSSDPITQALQPCQASKLNTRNAVALDSGFADVLDPALLEETAEFSDIENEGLTQQNGTLRQSAAQTPAGESKTGPVLISRTVPGLTFEPLVRPVITDDGDTHAQAGLSRPGMSTSQMPNGVPIMPEIMAAIRNLNECVVSQTAPPEQSTRASRSTRSKAPAKGSKAARNSDAAPADLVNRSSKDPSQQSSIPRAQSEASGTGSTDHRDLPVVVTEGSNTAAPIHLSNEDTSDDLDTIEVMADRIARPIERDVSSQHKQDEQLREKISEKPRNTRKSLSRQQLLMERNRLAMEAMEREEAGRNLRHVAV